MSISPAHCCAVLSPDVFTWAVMLLGVAPLCGEITSQFPQEVVFSEAVKLTVVPVLLVMETVCARGALVAICHSKSSLVGLTTTAAGPDSVTSTGTLIPVVPGALIANAALNGPEPVSAVGFAVTCIVPGKLPDVGFTVNQFPLSLVMGVTV